MNINPDKLVKAILETGLDQIPGGKILGAIAAPAFDHLGDSVKSSFANTVARECVKEIEPLAEQNTDLQGQGVWDNAVFEFEESLRHLPISPIFAIQHKLDVETIQKAISSARRPLQSGNRIRILHDALLGAFIRRYLIQMVELPEFRVMLYRELLLAQRA